MSDSYDSIHKQVNEFCAALEDLSESQQISQAGIHSLGSACYRSFAT